MPYVQTPSATLFVTEAGSPNAPPILFSNSLGTTHRMWDAVVAELSADFRCIRYDTRGHGASTFDARPFDIAALADDAVALMNNLGLARVHFAGLSLGGMTGQALAIHHPDRLASLTLMATSAFMPTEAAWNDRAALVRREGTKAIVGATLERWFTPGYRESAATSVEAVAAEFLAIDRTGYAGACEAIGRMDLRPDLGTIVAPTTIIAGAEDPATPLAMARELNQAIDGSELVVLSPAAHLLAVEQPERVCAELRKTVAMNHPGVAGGSNS
ncbi:3-oxoadipate enol-lactonase [Phreatobacter oligotrophus]|uniref:3-oxoadipate enol-lactonase n=1 Tax=Phreatobacter oligotrophus TaxID=1122261 RepID=A0A2T4YY68_9HYPH|nr:3-oxoadipate enol-lactonase [Phreatobacter oligotrophus]PTM51473.1 3-oxoadipate enol-lactonase [Phreatobacter oligotrophus]